MNEADIRGQMNYIYRTYSHSWNIVAPSVVVCAGRSSLHTGSHTITVVLTDKHTRQIPQLGHVKGLKQLTLVGCSIPIQCHTNVWLVIIFQSKGNTCSQWDLQYTGIAEWYFISLLFLTYICLLKESCKFYIYKFSTWVHSIAKWNHFKVRACYTLRITFWATRLSINHRW